MPAKAIQINIEGNLTLNVQLNEKKLNFFQQNLLSDLHLIDRVSQETSKLPYNTTHFKTVSGFIFSQYALNPFYQLCISSSVSDGSNFLFFGLHLNGRSKHLIFRAISSHFLHIQSKVKCPHDIV